MKQLLFLLSLACLSGCQHTDIWGRTDPHADFKILNNDCDAPCKVSFINTSSGNGNHYFWNLGIGISTIENPEQFYSDPGEYEVRLFAQNSARESEFMKIVTIKQPHIKPVVDFSLIIQTETVPAECGFTNKSLGAGNTYHWNFGDGNSDNSAEKHIMHTYFTEGIYIVTLSATNDLGTDSASQEVRVLPNFRSLKLKEVIINTLPRALTFYDEGQSFPASCPDLYIEVIDEMTQQKIIQNRDIGVLTDVQSLPITIPNKDDVALTYGNNFYLHIWDYEAGQPYYYDQLVAQTTLSFGISNVEKVIYPDNSIHWILISPLNGFSAQGQITGTYTLEFFP